MIQNSKEAPPILEKENKIEKEKEKTKEIKKEKEKKIETKQPEKSENKNTSFMRFEKTNGVHKIG